MKNLLLVIFFLLFEAKYFSSHSQTWQSVGGGFDLAAFTLTSDTINNIGIIV